MAESSCESSVNAAGADGESCSVAPDTSADPPRRNESCNVSGTVKVSAGETGYYECQLVQASQAAFQTHCPFCSLLLQDPSLVSCCSCKYCSDCVRKVLRDKLTCAGCGVANFTYTRDHGLQLFLRELVVWCCHRSSGCQWSGKVGELKLHLRSDAFSEEGRLSACQFVEVECSQGCGARLQRRNIQVHEMKECKERPFSCEYCQDYHSTFQDVTEVHHSECDRYPLPCPNKCQELAFERCELQRHLEQCSLAVVDCPFHYAGCNAKPLRKDLAEHMAQETAVHLSLLACVVQKLMTENQELKEREEKREREFRELKRRVETKEEESRRNMVMVRELLREREHKLQELGYRQQSTDAEIDSLKLETNRLMLEMTQHTSRSGFPINYRIKHGSEEVFLPPFFTHPHGYKLCLLVIPDGYGRANGTHVSLYMYMMQGPFDSNLKWPFRGEVTFQIVNQAGDHDHWVATSDKRLGGLHAVQVKGRDRAEGGWGIPQLIPHTTLCKIDSVKKIQYLKNEYFIIRIVSVKCSF